MARLQVVMLDASGNPQPGQTVRYKLAGTSTIVASTVSSETGGVQTIEDLGNGAYRTAGTYSSYLSSGDLVAGEYDIYKGATAVQENRAHVNDTDVTGALQAASNLSDLNSAATARQNLGVEIGVDVEAYNAATAGAASFVAGWEANGATFPFAHASGGVLALASAIGMRSLLGLDTAAVEPVESFLQVAGISTSAPPTADSSYVNKIWIRNSSTVYAIYICVRTDTSTYSWRLLRIDNAGGTADEAAYYTYGGA